MLNALGVVGVQWANLQAVRRTVTMKDSDLGLVYSQRFHTTAVRRDRAQSTCHTRTHHAAVARRRLRPCSPRCLTRGGLQQLTQHRAKGQQLFVVRSLVSCPRLGDPLEEIASRLGVARMALQCMGVIWFLRMLLTAGRAQT